MGVVIEVGPYRHLNLSQLKRYVRSGLVEVLNDGIGTPYFYNHMTEESYYLHDLWQKVAELPKKKYFSLDLKNRRRGIELLRSFRNLSQAAERRLTCSQKVKRCCLVCFAFSPIEDNGEFELFQINDPILCQIPKESCHLQQNGLVRVSILDWPTELIRTDLSENSIAIKKKQYREEKVQYKNKVQSYLRELPRVEEEKIEDSLD